MKKIIAAALSVVLVLAVSLYFGSSTTGLFYGGSLESSEDDDFSGDRSPGWEVIGKIDVMTGNVSVLTS